MFIVRMRRSQVLCCAALAVACAIGGTSCGGDGTSDSDGDGEGQGQGGGLEDTYGIDDGASEGATKSQRVTTTRSATLTLETGAAVELPEGAVARAIDITLERPSDEVAVALLDGLSATEVASAPYVLTPHGTAFLKPIKITLPVASASRGVPLRVAWRANESDPAWTTLGDATVSGNKASFTVDHFSIVVLLEGASGPIGGTPEAGIMDDIDGGLGDASALPEGGASVPARVTNVGASCTLEDEETDCLGAAAICRTSSMPGSVTNPGGMCSAVCTSSDQCGQNGTCPIGELIAQLGASTSLGATAHCAAACTQDDPGSCRSGYSCVTLAKLLSLGPPYNNAGPANTPFCYPNASAADAGVRLDGGAWSSLASSVPLTLQSLDSGL